MAYRSWRTAPELSRFFIRTATGLFRPPWDRGEIARHIYEIGWRSTPLIVIAGVVVGFLIAQLLWTALVNYGAVESIIPAELSRTMFRQSGPLLTGLLMSGRVGAAIGAEMAVLRLTEQIDALESLAIDSFRYLVITRVVACIITLPVLATVMSFSEIFGGFLWEALTAQMSLRLYTERVFDRVGWIDYIVPTLMTAFFGFVIGTVSSYFGYTVQENSAGVRRASMHSVVMSSLLVIALSIGLNQLLFVSFFQPGR